MSSAPGAIIMTMMLPAQEAEIRRIRFQSQPQPNSARDTISETPPQKGPPKMKK
jgi:hypothetical protein